MKETVAFYLSIYLTILAVFSYVQAAKHKETDCFVLLFLDTSWTDRRPDFAVNMTFGDQGNLQSKTWVNKEVAIPVTKLRVTQRGGDSLIRPQFNITARLCDVYNAFSKVPLFKKAFLSATEDSNLTLECPLKIGFYVMDNLRIDSDRILSFMYRPKMSYLFEGGMFEELKNKTLLPLTTYKFTTKVVKRPCKN